MRHGDPALELIRVECAFSEGGAQPLDRAISSLRRWVWDEGGWHLGSGRHRGAYCLDLRRTSTLDAIGSTELGNNTVARIDLAWLLYRFQSPSRTAAWAAGLNGERG